VLLLTAIGVCLLAADGGVDAGAEPDAGIALAPRKAVKNPLARKVDEARVERVFQSLDARGRAAQLLLAYPQIGKGAVEVGGVVFVGNSLKNLPKAAEKIASLRSRAKVEPFFAVDMEGGPSNRMKSLKALKDMPSARELAELDDAEVKAWGKKVGQAMIAVGLNLNLAPVLDVAATGHMANNKRSFSGDKAVVAKKAAAYSRGLLEAGVVPVGKHFPGYGDLEGDSDHALVSTPWTKERVLEEISVFKQDREVLGGVMLANVAYPAFNARPAILSPELVALAHESEWLAVTDDLSIQLLADAVSGTQEDVLKQALLAGNDLLLTTAPPDWDKGLDYLAILTKFSQEDPAAKKQIEAACRRVLRLKDRLGLLDDL
jgi:beta-N-acetylhexosaminidase